MKVKELINELEGYDENALVTIGEQPSQPLQHHIKETTRDEKGGVVILEADQIGYGSRDWWGW